MALFIWGEIYHADLPEVDPVAMEAAAPVQANAIDN
jgi:hypothetical protein